MSLGITRWEVRAKGGASTAIWFSNASFVFSSEIASSSSDLLSQNEQWLQGHTSVHWGHLLTKGSTLCRFTGWSKLQCLCLLKREQCPVLANSWHTRPFFRFGNSALRHKPLRARSSAERWRGHYKWARSGQQCPNIGESCFYMQMKNTSPIISPCAIIKLRRVCSALS